MGEREKRFISETIEKIREQVDGHPKIGPKVVVAASGGVDSSVTLALVHRAVNARNHRAHAIFVDTGLMREGESKEVLDILHRVFIGFPVMRVNAAHIFLGALSGIIDPEEKRMRIGETYIRLFEKHAPDTEFLAQGTIRADVVEAERGIKAQHNTGGMPKDHRFKLIEPLAGLYKSEVRLVAKELGLPDEIVNRRPFPGPGLATRIIGEVTWERLEILRRADTILRETIAEYGIPVSQEHVVLLPDVRTTGLSGDGNRTYGMLAAVRLVQSEDFMLATASWPSSTFLHRVAERITNGISCITRVVYDLTDKPPATVEWE